MEKTKLPEIPGMDVEKTLNEYYVDITRLLIKYGELNPEKVEQLIDNSGLFKDLDTIYDLAFLFHEEPYYWAMDLLHRPNNPEWAFDPKLWPPPEGCYD